MKKKADFITNSSSASFIIATTDKENKPPIIEVKINVNLEDYADKVIKTSGSLYKYWHEILYKESEGDEEYNKCLEILKKGGTIYFLECSDESEDPIESLMCKHGLDDLNLPDNIKVIQGEGGY